VNALEGDAAQMGVVLAGIARSSKPTPSAAAPRCCCPAGETRDHDGQTHWQTHWQTTGKGGRNTTFLPLAIALNGAPKHLGRLRDTDGHRRYGRPSRARFFVPEHPVRARAEGVDARRLSQRMTAMGSSGR